MKQKYQYLVKNIGILTLSNFSSKILVFLLVPLYTSVLSTTEYGIFDLVSSTVQLLMPIFTANIMGAVMRFIMDSSIEKDYVVEIGVKYIMSGCLFMGITLYLVSKSDILKDVTGLEYLIFFYYVFYSINQFLIQLSKGLECVSDMAVAGFIGTASMLVANVFFLLVFYMGLKGFFIANILAQAVPAFYLIFKQRIWNYFVLSTHKKQKNYNILKREMLSYSVPLILTDIGWWVNNSFDRYIVIGFCGTMANGLLAVAYKIPAILNVFQGIFIQAWQISAVKEIDNEENNNFYNQSYVYMNMVICIMCAGLILLSKQIAYVLYAKDFFNAWKYVPFLLVSSLFNAVAGYFGPLLAAKKDSVSMAESAFYGALANIILDIILVKYIGIQGAAIATAVSSYIIYFIRKRAADTFIAIRKDWHIVFSWVLVCIQAFASVYSASVIMQIFLFIVIIILYAAQLKSLLYKLFRKGGEIMAGEKKDIPRKKKGGDCPKTPERR